MAKGKGGGAGPSASKALEAIATQTFEESTPARQELLSQFLEGLRTGGVEARIPIVQRGVEESRAATSGALRQLDEQLALTGMAGTPFGQRIRAETLTAGEQAASRIPLDVIQQFLSQVPGFVTGQQQISVSGLGQAGAAQANVQSAQIAAFAQLMSALTGAGGRVGSAAILA